MNEWLQRIMEQARALWGKWSTTQKIILFAVVGAAIAAIVLLVAFSSQPSMVALIGTPITDDGDLARIATKLDEENVAYQVRADGRLYVDDERTARRMRAILVREDLIPAETDPFAIFDVDRFSITDFERNVNLQRALTRNLEQHILALDDVDAASVTLVIPERELFTADQNPTTASVIITPRLGSDITENRKKLEGIQALIELAVAGLQPDNIVITDHRGTVLNDFDGLAEFDRLALTERQIRTKFDLERRYKNEILAALQRVFTADRVEIVKLDIALDFSEESTQTEEHFPITMRPDNPLTPFDETEVVPSLTISREAIDESFRGTGFNPEGPPGQEGQTPPAYQDLRNLQGEYDRNSIIQNEAVNTRSTTGQKSPWTIDRVTVSVVVDGIWRRLYDANGNVLFETDGSTQREYTPVADEDLGKAAELIQGAIGFDRARGDTVTVEHLQFDRTAQFLAEDEVFRRQAQLRRLLLAAIIGLAGLFVLIIFYRWFARQIERRRRLREEELARQHQAMREAALRSAEEQGPEVELSIEDRAKMEMQESAMNLAREHPEEVAQLLRTWLVEE